MTMPEAKISTEITDTDAQLYVYSNMDYNSKVGGWGVSVVTKDGKKVYAGNEATRLIINWCWPAVREYWKKLNGLKSLVVYSDSEYLTNGMSKWLAGWMNVAGKRPAAIL